MSTFLAPKTVQPQKNFVPQSQQSNGPQSNRPQTQKNFVQQSNGPQKNFVQQSNGLQKNFVQQSNGQDSYTIFDSLVYASQQLPNNTNIQGLLKSFASLRETASQIFEDLKSAENTRVNENKTPFAPHVKKALKALSNVNAALQQTPKQVVQPVRQPRNVQPNRPQKTVQKTVVPQQQVQKTVVSQAQEEEKAEVPVPIVDLTEEEEQRAFEEEQGIFTDSEDGDYEDGDQWVQITPQVEPETVTQSQ
jgi:CHASE3 domain sensor protein